MHKSVNTVVALALIANPYLTPCPSLHSHHACASCAGAHARYADVVIEALELEAVVKARSTQTFVMTGVSRPGAGKDKGAKQHYGLSGWLCEDM